jgi:hypothetical protein
MKSLYKSYDMEVSQAHIIYIPNNEVSVRLAERCLKSCESVNQKASLYEGFDGTSNEIKVPLHCKDQSWIKWLKVTDHQQSISEISCSLSHISLWVKCMEEDKPLIILEHDAIMLHQYPIHQLYNGIIYLGCTEQRFNKNIESIPIPPHSSINKNWNFINRAHAYSIDPSVAKNLFKMVLDRGIYESLDVMMRVDDFAIAQFDLCAYEEPGITTIIDRKK